MTIQKAVEDGEIRELITLIYKHRAFDRLRVAFISHSPKGDDKSETSIEVAHGQNLGTRYVFNTIEELATTPPSQKPNPRRQGGADPDMAT